MYCAKAFKNTFKTMRPTKWQFWIKRFFGSIVILLVTLLTTWFKIGEAKAKENPFSNYESARMAWLNLPYPPKSGNPIYRGDAEAYMVGMEFTISSATGNHPKAIVLASSIGDASIFFESNNAQGVGGFIGGITHEHIAQDAISMVKLASEKVSIMRLTKDFPFVSPQHVRFIVATKRGRYTIEMPEQDVRKKENSLFSLYSKGQQIMTDFRLLSSHEPKSKL